jgi:hypothetical protein
VQRYVARSGYGSNVPVLESTRTDDGWPADRINALAAKAASAAMDPKLMSGSAGAAAGGGH